MYEEITELEADIIKALDKAREKKQIPTAVIMGVLDVVKAITIRDSLERFAPVEDKSLLKTETVLCEQENNKSPVIRN